MSFENEGLLYVERVDEMNGVKVLEDVIVGDMGGEWNVSNFMVDVILLDELNLVVMSGVEV